MLAWQGRAGHAAGPAGSRDYGHGSHADHGDLLRSLGPLVGTANKVRLVHGEPDRQAALADGLRGVGFADVVAPERGDSVEI